MSIRIDIGGEVFPYDPASDKVYMEEGFDRDLMRSAKRICFLSYNIRDADGNPQEIKRIWITRTPKIYEAALVWLHCGCPIPRPDDKDKYVRAFNLLQWHADMLAEIKRNEEEEDD